MRTMVLDRKGLWVVGLIVGPLALAAAMMVALGLFVLKERFVDSELVLTAAGCAAIERHGGSVEPMAGSGLCKVTADYGGAGWFTRHASLRVPVGGEAKAIELRSSDIVSRSTRDH